jgi:hypothetical protein
MSASGRIYVVAQNHSDASDEGAGDEQNPFATINRAADLAEPGDTVLVHEGVYRERVSPRRGGLEGKPIVYAAASKETVFIRGSDVFTPSWKPVGGCDGVYSGALSDVKFGIEAYAGQADEAVNGEFNPYLLNFNRGAVARPRAKALSCFEAEVGRLQSIVDQPEDDSSGTGKAGFLRQLSAAQAELEIASRDDDPRLLTTLGQVFVDGRPMTEVEFESDLRDVPGRHVIRSNRICDNGHCGIAGLGHYGTRVLGNVIERNNRTGYTSPWWEFGGIKFHFFYDGLIEGNLVRDNEAHGIWIDNQWRGSRITRNVIVNNLWSGVNCELGRGPVLIDNNIIAYTRQGDGIYGHDASDVTIAHNLIYANANFGVWFAYCTNRVKNEDGCWDIRTLNNMILGNKVGAVAYPMPWECAGNNVSEGNLLMGGGEYLDEGSGPMPPLFQFTNKTHCGQFNEYCGASVPMTRENTLALFKKLLAENDIHEKDWPNLDQWQDSYFVNLEIWRKIMACDIGSRVVNAIRDGLQSRIVSWDMQLDEAVREIKCRPVDGVDKDFRGRPLDSSPLPGPFQAIEAGRNHIVLWPVRGVPTSCVLE